MNPFWPIVRTIRDTKQLKSRKSRCSIPVHIYTANSKGDYHFIGLIELSKSSSSLNFAKADVDSYIRKNKEGKAVRVKSHKRKFVEAVGTLTAGGALVGAALLLVRKKHIVKNTGKFDSANPTEWLSKQAKANADEANSVVDVLRKGDDITQSKVKPKKVREPDIWDEPLAPFSTLVNRGKTQGSQPLLLSPAKDNLTKAIEGLPKPRPSKAGVYNDEIFPIAPEAYFHGATSKISKIRPIDETSTDGLYYGGGLYTTSSFDVAKNYYASAAKNKDAIVYQILPISKALDSQLLDFDDDVSSQVEGLLKSFGLPVSAKTKTLVKEYGTLNKLATIQKRQKGQRVADTETGFEKVFRSIYTEIQDNEFISDKLAREQMGFIRSYLNNRSAIVSFSDYLRKNTKYRGLKGKQIVNPGEGEYKVYWYPEQDLRVERVM